VGMETKHPPKESFVDQMNARVIGTFEDDKDALFPAFLLTWLLTGSPLV
jgi:hypothetical protein